MEKLVEICIFLAVCLSDRVDGYSLVMIVVARAVENIRIVFRKCCGHRLRLLKLN